MVTNTKKHVRKTKEEEDIQFVEPHHHDVGHRGRTGPLPPSPIQFVGPPIHPLAPPPPKRVKTHHFEEMGHPQYPQYPPYASPAMKAPAPRSAVLNPTVHRGSPAKSPSKGQRRSPSTENPYSTSRGLRHFSMKVCEKVEEKGTTTYNEVADELVRELRQAEEAINRAAAARGEAVPAAKQKKRKSTSGKDSGKKAKNHDDKNIRRRVYDALNVLMAMDIITKDKKEITWRGLPGSRVREDAESPDKRKDGMSRRQRVKELQAEMEKRREDVRRKKECLQELMVQNVCFQNLLGRNHARELDEQRRRSSPASIKSEEQGGEENDDAKSCEVKEHTDEKIPLPFLLVNTDSRAVVQCEMCPKRTNVSFDFSLPFEINDDNEILKRLGMNCTSKEALQRSLPPDLFHYCNGKGLLQGVARSR